MDIQEILQNDTPRTQDSKAHGLVHTPELPLFASAMRFSPQSDVLDIAVDLSEG